MIEMVYDGAGNRTQVFTDLFGYPALDGLVSYTYDTKDRLTSETSTRLSGFADTFAYDGANNPTTFRGSSRSYNSANQFSATGFAYDDRGNPTTYGGSSVSFDLLNNATQFGSVLTSGYRGDGLRAWKDNGTSTAPNRTYYLYDGMTPVAEIDASGNTLATNTFGANGLISRRKTSGTSPSTSISTHYTFDERGNTVERLNSGGTVDTLDLYTAYGSLQFRGGSTTGFDDPFEQAVVLSHPSIGGKINPPKRFF